MKLWATWAVTFFNTSSNAFLIKGIWLLVSVSGTRVGEFLREGRKNHQPEVDFSNNSAVSPVVDSLDEALTRMTKKTFGSCDSGESSVSMYGSPGQMCWQKNKWTELSKQPRNEAAWEPLAAQGGHRCFFWSWWNRNYTGRVLGPTSQTWGWGDRQVNNSPSHFLPCTRRAQCYLVLKAGKGQIS